MYIYITTNRGELITGSPISRDERCNLTHPLPSHLQGIPAKRAMSASVWSSVIGDMINQIGKICNHSRTFVWVILVHMLLNSINHIYIWYMWIIISFTKVVVSVCPNVWTFYKDFIKNVQKNTAQKHMSSPVFFCCVHSLKLTAILPLKIDHPKKEGQSSSTHPFSGANCCWFQGGVLFDPPQPPTGVIIWHQPKQCTTVDGWNLAITTWYVKTLQIMGEATNLNWCRISAINSIRRNLIKITHDMLHQVWSPPNVSHLMTPFENWIISPGRLGWKKNKTYFTKKRSPSNCLNDPKPPMFL